MKEQGSTAAPEQSPEEQTKPECRCWSIMDRIKHLRLTVMIRVDHQLLCKHSGVSARPSVLQLQLRELCMCMFMFMKRWYEHVLPAVCQTSVCVQQVCLSGRLT